MPAHLVGGQRPRWGVGRILLLGVALMALVAVGCVLAVRVTGSDSAPPPPAAGVTAATAAPLPVPPIAPLAKAEPTEVKVPAIGASSSLIGLGLGPGNSMATPPVSKPGQASWFTGGPTPGQKGPAVILGHINGDGHPGVFQNLVKLKAGDQIEVDRADHTAAYFTVTGAEQVGKNAFPAGQVFNDVPDAQLRLISCGGALDVAEHSYDDNIIVFATMTRVAHI